MSFIDITGDASSVVKIVDELSDKLSNAGLFTFQEERVWPWLLERTERRFANEGDDAVGVWRELSRNTWQYRKDQGFPAKHPINERTGGLKEFAMSHETGPQASGMTLTQPRKGGTTEQNRKLKHAQRGGKSDKGRTFQARPVVALSHVDTMHIQRNLVDYILGGGGVV